MAYLLLSIAILCFAYSLAIRFSFKRRLSARWIWFAAGLYSLATAVLWFANIPFIPALLAAVELVTLLVCIIGSVVVAKSASPSSSPRKVDWIIVLGAQIAGNKPTAALQYRLDATVDFWHKHPTASIIVTGGQGPGEEFTEASVMQTYLANAGIPQSQIFTEEAANSTESNLSNSLEIINSCTNDTFTDNTHSNRAQTNNTCTNRVQTNNTCTNRVRTNRAQTCSASVGVVTSNFHIRRALLYAKQAGFIRAFGIPSYTNPILWVHYVFRESIALVTMKLPFRVGGFTIKNKRL